MTPHARAHIRHAMQGNRRVNTQPELRLRSELHSRGLRYRKDVTFYAAGRRVRPDVTFTGPRVAVFVDGCFWHRCPEHATDPQSHVDYWRQKFTRNLERDRADDAALAEVGWEVIRVWEHEAVADAADRVEQSVCRRARVLREERAA